jgi:hypothetical protein
VLHEGAARALRMGGEIVAEEGRFNGEPREREQRRREIDLRAEPSEALARPRRVGSQEQTGDSDW